MSPPAPADVPFTYGIDGRDVSYEVPTVVVRVQTPSRTHALHVVVLDDTNIEQVPEYRSNLGASSLGRTPAAPELVTYVVHTKRLTLRLCAGTCYVALGAGLTYRMRVELEDPNASTYLNRTVSVRITPRTIRLNVEYVHRRKHRIRRTVGILAVAVFGGVLMGIAPRANGRWCERRADACAEDDRNQALFWSGVTLAASPAATILIPVLTGDGPRIRVIEASDEDEAP